MPVLPFHYHRQRNRLILKSRSYAYEPRYVQDFVFIIAISDSFILFLFQVISRRKIEDNYLSLLLGKVSGYLFRIRIHIIPVNEMGR